MREVILFSFFVFNWVQFPCRLGPQKNPVSFKGSARAPPLFICSVEIIQQVEGAKILVKLEVVVIVVFTGLQKWQVVSRVLYEGVDDNMGVPGNLDNDMTLEEHRGDAYSCQIGYNILNGMSITGSEGNWGDPLVVLLVYTLVEVLVVQHRMRVIENEFLHY